MFGQAVIHRPVHRGKFNQGLIAETLLFYSEVLILFDRHSLSQAIETIGLDGLLILREEFGVKFSFHGTMFATMTNTYGSIKAYRFASMKLGAKNGRQLRDIDEMEELIEEKAVNQRNIKKIMRRLTKGAPGKTLAGDDIRAVCEAALDELSDRNFSAVTLPEVINYNCPGASFSTPLRFDTQRVGHEFMISSNIDFDYLTERHKSAFGQNQGAFDAPRLASSVIDARAEICFAGTYNSSYVTDPLSSNLMRRRFLELIRRRDRTVQETDLFQEIHLDGFKSIGDTINTGQVSLKDFFPILKKARGFKNWLNEQNPDSRLLDEYFRACTEQSWINRCLGKTTRFVVTNGLSSLVGSLFSPVAGAAAALGISAADSFLLDKIFGGWKPNQFVDGPLKAFLSGP